MLTDLQKKISLERVEHYASQNITAKQIALCLGVSFWAVLEWQDVSANTYWPEFANAYERGRFVLLNRLENALYKRAEGFAVAVNGEEKYYAPDVGALCFALCNLSPDKWKNRISEEKKFSGQVKIVYTDENSPLRNDQSKKQTEPSKN